MTHCYDTEESPFSIGLRMRGLVPAVPHTLPLIICFTLLVLSILLNIFEDIAYYYGWMDCPLADGTPSRWVGW